MRSVKFNIGPQPVGHRFLETEMSLHGSASFATMPGCIMAGKRNNRSPRRGSKRRRRQQDSVPKPSNCRALLVIDSSSIRRKAVADCRRARTTFEKAESELQVYESRDKPAFTRWYRSVFGSRIAELKAHYDEATMLRERLHRFFLFADMKGCDVREAARIYDRSVAEFERIEASLRERERKRQEEEQRKAESRRQELKTIVLGDLKTLFSEQKARTRRYLKRGESKFDLLCSLLALYEEETGLEMLIAMDILRCKEGRQILTEAGLDGAMDDPFEFAEDDDDPDLEDVFENIFGSPFADGEGPEPSPSRREEGTSEAEDAKLKTLWRELAFALHPDQSDAASQPAARELWHQVQEAMKDRDLDRMEILHAHVQVMKGEWSPAAPVSNLMAMTRMYRESRDALRRRIRMFRKAPDWGFTAATEESRERIQASMAALLEEEIREAKAQLDEIRSHYEWECKDRKTRGAHHTPRKNPDQMMFDDW